MPTCQSSPPARHSSTPPPTPTTYYIRLGSANLHPNVRSSTSPRPSPPNLDARSSDIPRFRAPEACQLSTSPAGAVSVHTQDSNATVLRRAEWNHVSRTSDSSSPTGARKICCHPLAASHQHSPIKSPRRSAAGPVRTTPPVIPNVPTPAPPAPLDPSTFP
ncbi:hypothetical protein GQ53DRAFT_331546 [Thozetella sp. PMI_491]|nr:hypothetical protein GQ53DRAFT_331546 [Thozetella sp. PMI_491]